MNKKYNRLKLIVTLFIFIALIIFVLPINIKVSASGAINKPKVTSADKPYISNIPNIWYDEQHSFGAYSTNIKEAGIEDYRGYYDLISEDGSTNYAGVPYFHLRTGEQLCFYLETGFTMWGGGVPSPDFAFPQNLKATTCIVNQEYQGITYELFDSSLYNSPDSPIAPSYYQALVSSTGDNNSNKFIIEDPLDDENAIINDDYRMPLITIEANSKGFDVFNFDITTEIGEDSHISFSFVVLVYDDNDPILSNKSINIKAFDNTAYLESFNIYDGMNILLPHADFSSYNIFGGYSTFDQAAAGTITPYHGEYRYEIYDGKDNLVKSTFYINNPGTYEYKVKYLLDIVNNDDASTIDTLLIDESSFNFIVYNDELNPGLYKDFYEIQPVDNTLNLFSSDRIQDYDIYDENGQFINKRYYLDGALIDDNTELTAGIHNFVIEATNESYLNAINYSNSNYDTSYSTSLANFRCVYQINVRDDEDLNPVPILDMIDGETFSIIDMDLIDISITNADYLMSCGANITYFVNYSEELYFDFYNPTLYIKDYCLLGENEICIFVENFEGDSKYYSYYFNINCDDVDYGIAETDIKIVTGESSFVRLGVLSPSGNLQTIPGFDFWMNEKKSFGTYNFAFYPTNKDVVRLRSYEGYSSELEFEGLNPGKTKAILVLTFGKDTLKIFDLNIEVADNFGSEGLNINESFNEGEILRAVLDSSTEANLTIPTGYSAYSFNWLSTNTNVAVVTNHGSYATLEFGSKGEAEIFAIYQNGNDNIVFKTKVIVVDEIPTISINIDKLSADSASLSIYDILSIKVNNNGFVFSPDTIYEWYLDDELLETVINEKEEAVNLSTKATNFNYKFSEGTHTIKVVLKDELYGFNLEATKEISISKIVNQERILSFDIDKLLLITSGSSYELSVLMDGVINDDFNYNWLIDDSSICKLYSNSSSKVTILPIASGNSTITVFCNIGKYEDLIIKYSIEVQIDELKDLSFKLSNEYPKPNEPLTAQVLINGSPDYKNVLPIINATLNDEAIEYTFDESNNKLSFNNVSEGKLSLSASFQGVNSDLSVKVTNFNIKEFLTKIMPYLLIVLVLVVLGYTLYRIRNNPLKNVSRHTNKLDNEFNKFIDKLNNGLFNKKFGLFMAFVSLKYRSKKLLNTLTYYYDEGIDEFKHSIPKIKLVDDSIKVIKKNKKNIDEAMLKEVIANMYNDIYKNAKMAIDIEVESRVKFEDTARDNNLKDAKLYREENAKKKEARKAKKANNDKKGEMIDYLEENGMIEHK